MFSGQVIKSDKLLSAGFNKSVEHDPIIELIRGWEGSERTKCAIYLRMAVA